MVDHNRFMARCLDLAQLGMGSVSPNPMVGSVIVCDDIIIGEGYHMKFGAAHAEVNAINNVVEAFTDAEDLLQRSTLYVSLEPCSHFGKTPPCAELIIAKKIPRVVVGCRDPNRQVNGNGIAKLRESGVEVIEGILEPECTAFNKRFFTRITKQRPYIILKWAQSRDGYFAPEDGSQRWITSSVSKQVVHRWRSEEDAVLVGKNTAKADNPQLNVREWHGKNPVRIIIDRNLELMPELHIFDQSQDTIIFNSLRTEITGRIKYLELDDFESLLPQLICYQLYLMDIQSIIIEGGLATLNLFLRANLWDEARVLTGPETWSKGLKSPVLLGTLVETVRIGPDNLNIWQNKSL